MQAIRDYQRMNCWAEQDQLDTSPTLLEAKERIRNLLNSQSKLYAFHMETSFF